MIKLPIKIIYYINHDGEIIETESIRIGGKIRFNISENNDIEFDAQDLDLEGGSIFSNRELAIQQLSRSIPSLLLQKLNHRKEMLEQIKTLELQLAITNQRLKELEPIIKRLEKLQLIT